MKNFTQTIIFNTSTPIFKSNEEGKAWKAAYDKHYKEVVKPIFDNTEKCVNQIAELQPTDINNGNINILWNKCRYFELSAPKHLLRFVAQSAKVKIQYGSMLVGGSNKLEAVVRAFNKKGVYCNITQDWI
jgi:hypothetical protein